jgi:hypothetical protein
VRPGLHLLVRIDSDAGHDHRLGPDLHLVTDGDPFVDPDVRADVAGASEDRSFDQAAAADVRRGVDHRTCRARPLTERDAVREDGVLAHARARRDPAVVSEQRGPLHLLEIRDLDALAEPHVAANADPGDVQPHALVERVEIRLAVLVEVADVLPVAVHDVPV